MFFLFCAGTKSKIEKLSPGKVENSQKVSLGMTGIFIILSFFYDKFIVAAGENF